MMGVREDTTAIGVHTAVLIGLGTLAVVALGMHALAVQGEREREYGRHLESVVDVGCRAIETTSEGVDAAHRVALFRHWSWAALADRAVVGAALLDANGTLVAWQPRDLAGESSLADVLSAKAGSVDLGEPLGRALVYVGSSDSGWRLILLARPRGLAVLAVVSWWMFPLGLAAGIALGWGWVRSTLENTLWMPLRRMVRATSAGGAGRPERLPTERADDLGRLARNVVQLLDEHERSRARLGHLKRTMDVQVAERTRRIESMLKRAERKAWIDPLTRLGNRQLLEDRLEELFAGQVQRDEDMAIIVFDLDNFKALNDTLGHAAGDELLSFFGELLRGSLRSSDIGLRLGGDEFVVILLGSGSSEAAETADRLIKLFGQRASLLQVSPKVMISAGAAALRDVDPADGAELLRRADLALYDAKAKGKGRVCVCGRKDARAGTRSA